MEEKRRDGRLRGGRNKSTAARTAKATIPEYAEKYDKLDELYVKVENGKVAPRAAEVMHGIIGRWLEARKAERDERDADVMVRKMAEFEERLAELKRMAG